MCGNQTPLPQNSPTENTELNSLNKTFAWTSFLHLAVDYGVVSMLFYSR